MNNEYNKNIEDEKIFEKDYVDYINILNLCINYFNESSRDKINEKYASKIKNINHDETWLTLISIFSLFGSEYKNNKPNILDALSDLMVSANLHKPNNINGIIDIKLELALPEISSYRDYLYNLSKNEFYHCYPDRNAIIADRRIQRKESLEGNTNLDVFVKFTNGNSTGAIFIESKFISDIDYKTKYIMGRNQLIRNIDAMIDFALNPKNMVDLNNVFFILLTPEIFKYDKFSISRGYPKPPMLKEASRLYCYKMNEYSNFNNLKSSLPHRNLTDEQWRVISKNIGWLSFEDILQIALKNNTIGHNYKNVIEPFFIKRSLVAPVNDYNAQQTLSAHKN